MRAESAEGDDSDERCAVTREGAKNNCISLKGYDFKRCLKRFNQPKPHVDHHFLEKFK